MSVSRNSPAGYGHRFLAQLIDSLVVIGIAGIGFGVSIFVDQQILSILIALVCTAVVVVYEPYFIATHGATPGKRTMGLRVVNQNGGSISVGKSIVRYLLKSILSGIFWIVALFTEKRQCIHDLIVGTYVVRV